ncbi:MAG: hypothetical protein KC877_03075 [Candidatus Kaiserbacteria bacterium]|nr:hypothetical protein [Candidatus Kaiserbacteria bacterium]MCB9816702.1 hypothetical protein [Candidatus Nomurabacteria bacterium]
MNKIIIAAAILILAPLTSLADLSGELSLGGKSKYVYNGYEVRDNPLGEANAYVEHDSGFYLNGWFALNDVIDFEEIDGTVGKIIEIDEGTSLDLSVSWFNIPDMNNTTGDAIVAAARIDHDFMDMSGFVGVEYWKIIDDSASNGFIFHGGVSKDFSLDTVTLTPSIRAGYDTTYEEEVWFGELSLAPSIALGDTTLTFLETTYTMREREDSHWVVGMSISTPIF